MSKLLRNGILALAVGIGAGAAWAGTAQAGDDSPLKKWMKDNLVAAKAAGDYKKLEAALTKLGAANPDAKAFPKWKEYSDQGVAAAKKSDKEGVNASCKNCHDAYRNTYKQGYRDKPAPN